MMKIWTHYHGVLKLTGGILMIPLIAWFLGFRQTFRMWRESQVQQQKLERLYVDENKKQKSALREEITTEQVLNNGILLERLSSFINSHEVAIMKYTPYLTSEEGNLQICTGELVLNGGFIPLLKVMNRVENDKSLGQIVSSTFQAYPDKMTQKREVKMTLVIQQLTMVK